MKHLFILNRFAGTHDGTDDILKKINAVKTDDEIFIEYTRGRNDAARITSEYLEKSSSYLRIYACGGDGTAGEVLQSMIGHDRCALGVIPAGTGNDFIRSLHVSENDLLDIDKMIHGSTLKIDVLKCDDIYALNYASAGYDCEVAYTAQKIKRWPLMQGSLAYKLSIFYCLFTKRRHTFYPVSDGERIPLPKGYKSQMLTVIGNGKYYGGGIKCTPFAELDDGLIEFMSIPTISVPRFASLLSLFIKGEHLNNPKLPFITYSRCKKVQLRDSRPIRMCIDGELVILSDPVIEIIEKAVNIIIPKGR